MIPRFPTESLAYLQQAAQDSKQTPLELAAAIGDVLAYVAETSRAPATVAALEAEAKELRQLARFLLAHIGHQQIRGSEWAQERQYDAVLARVLR